MCTHSRSVARGALFGLLQNPCIVRSAGQSSCEIPGWSVVPVRSEHYQPQRLDYAVTIMRGRAAGKRGWTWPGPVSVQAAGGVVVANSQNIAWCVFREVSHPAFFGEPGRLVASFRELAHPIFVSTGAVLVVACCEQKPTRPPSPGRLLRGHARMCHGFPPCSLLSQAWQLIIISLLLTTEDTRHSSTANTSLLVGRYQVCHCCCCCCCHAATKAELLSFAKSQKTERKKHTVRIRINSVFGNGVLCTGSGAPKEGEKPFHEFFIRLFFSPCFRRFDQIC